MKLFLTLITFLAITSSAKAVLVTMDFTAEIYNHSAVFQTLKDANGGIITGQLTYDTASPFAAIEGFGGYAYTAPIVDGGSINVTDTVGGSVFSVSVAMTKIVVTDDFFCGVCGGSIDELQFQAGPPGAASPNYHITFNQGLASVTTMNSIPSLFHLADFSGATEIQYSSPAGSWNANITSLTLAPAQGPEPVNVPTLPLWGFAIFFISLAAIVRTVKRLNS